MKKKIITKIDKLLNNRVFISYNNIKEIYEILDEYKNKRNKTKISQVKERIKNKIDKTNTLINGKDYIQKNAIIQIIEEEL